MTEHPHFRRDIWVVYDHPRDYPNNYLELQVRTLAQHLWSEMSHDSVYKSEDAIAKLPPDLRRRVNLMAGQIEVADREFDRLQSELADDLAAPILRVLERHYYTLSTRRPDSELSLRLVRQFMSLYDKPPVEAAVDLDAFLNTNHSDLENIYSVATQEAPPELAALLYQPEALLIYERLINDAVSIKSAWNETYQEKELERIANTFGISFD